MEAMIMHAEIAHDSWQNKETSEYECSRYVCVWPYFGYLSMKHVTRTVPTRIHNSPKLGEYECECRESLGWIVSAHVGRAKINIGARHRVLCGEYLCRMGAWTGPQGVQQRLQLSRLWPLAAWRTAQKLQRTKEGGSVDIPFFWPWIEC